MKLDLIKHRQWLLEIARNAGDKHFDPETQLCLIKRDTVWYAISLLFDDSEERRAFGNSILENIQIDDATHTPATLLAIHYNVPDLLTPKAKENIFNNVEQSLIKAAVVEWHDGNANHPLAAYCSMICGGELCNQTWAIELGYHKLKTFQRTISGRQHRFRKQAEMSEYNSPTYTALDLWFLAIIAEHSNHAAAKKLGLFLEQKLWIDIAMHFHAPSQQFAGPHSRAYQTDSIGGYTALHCTMLAAFGDELYLNSKLAEKYNHTSNLVQNSLIAIIRFHVPELARKLAWEKPFPYYFQKTTYCEQYHENSRKWIATFDDSYEESNELKSLITGNVPDVIHAQSEIKAAHVMKIHNKNTTPFAFDDEVYAGGWSDLTTYTTKEYALGTASLPYVNGGQTDCFSLRIRRSEKIQSMNDFRSAYTRAVFNDSVVGQKNNCHITGGKIDESYLYEEGRCAIYQYRNRAIVCYAPKRSGHLGIKSFRLDLIFSHFSPFTSLVIDGQTVTNIPITCTNDTRIYFYDYKTYGVIIPLTLSPVCSDHPIVIWKKNDYLMISFYNYDDNLSDFTREDINRWRNGFVIELAIKDKYLSFNDFIAYTKSAVIEEHAINNSERNIIYKSGKNKMEFHYDPLREIILSRKWNGEQEIIDHLYVESNGQSDGEYCPESIFGEELHLSHPRRVLRT